MSDVNYGISNVGTVMTSCAGTQHLTPYHAKLERVKFGVSLDQVCRPDLPGPLLVSWLDWLQEVDLSLFLDDAAQAEQGGTFQEGSVPSPGSSSKHEETHSLSAAGNNSSDSDGEDSQG